jgi:hypothetical protein
LSTVEILDDEQSNEWREGPELPFAIDAAKMVEDKDGGVVLVGGSASSGALDTLFQLRHGGEGVEWVEMEQKLKSPRNRHVAFLVPDHIAECH